jgi:hypothetical protein
MGVAISYTVNEVRNTMSINGNRWWSLEFAPDGGLIVKWERTEEPEEQTEEE